MYFRKKLNVWLFFKVAFFLFLWCTLRKMFEMEISLEDLKAGANETYYRYKKRNEEYSVAMDFLDRISNMQYQCKLQKHNGTERLPRLLTAKWNNLKYCKVTKSGSTFWMSVFVIINKIAFNPFGKKRVDLHMDGEKFKKQTTLLNISSSDVVVLVGRDPFSRIYSAFVDKIYLPGFWHTYTRITEANTPTCDKSNTFSVFVDYIIRNRLNGKPLDEHWRPISQLCKPCRIPYNFIVKQETFQRDVEFVLNRTNISPPQRKQIYDGLKDKHVKYSMEGVIKEMALYGKKVNKKCMSFDDFTRRLWTAFQIQGYISDTIVFPEDKFSGLNYSTVNEMTKLYLQGVNQFKLRTTERLYQRNKYLRQAYITIHNDSLQQFLKIYRNDFRLFGYSPIPPHLKHQ